MGGSDPRTLVLVGKTGNGKSATGNSILGEKRFRLNRCFSGGTTASKLETRVLEDGQMLTVIDTPGFFDSSAGGGTIREIMSCIKLAMDGIHAVLVVISVCNRLFEEEKSAMSSLQMLFGKQICDYMIVVFTGGDEVEEDGKTLVDFLNDCPQALKEILCLCGNRYVLFDNKTNNEAKKSNQVHQLFSCVNMVLEKNGGEPYANEIFTDLKKWTKESQKTTEELEVLKKTKSYSEHEMLELMEKMCLERLKPQIEMMEMMLMNIKLKIEQELLVEQAARLKVEGKAKAARKKPRKIQLVRRKSLIKRKL